MLPKDYIAYKMTGVHSTDMSDASGMQLLDVKNRCWSTDVCKALGVDLSVAVTGIAGPTGGTPTKPVGLVYIAVASENGVAVTENHFSGDREAVRLQTVEKALTLLNAEIRKHR